MWLLIYLTRIWEWGFSCSSAGKESACSAGDPSSIPREKIPWRRDSLPTPVFMASLVSQMAKNLPAVWETWVWSLGWEDSLEEGMATHSSVPAWSIPMDRGAWRASVHGVTKSRHDWVTKHSTSTRIFIATLFVIAPNWKLPSAYQQ